MIEKDFDSLLTAGNVAFYESCEVTQLFLQNRVDRTISNLFTLAVFEEKPCGSLRHKFLTPKPIKVNKEHCLGIQRYRLSIAETVIAFNGLCERAKWDDTLKLGKLNALTKQFIPSHDGNRINHVLKNNFHNGSYILEFFDESKEYTDILFDIQNLKLLNTLNDEVKRYVPIDLSIARDRIGNIVFQFPVTALHASSKSLKTWDGVKLTFNWHHKLKTCPDCLIQVESIMDKNFMGGRIVDYNKSAQQDIVIGNLDQVSHIRIWKREPNLLLSTFDGTFIREMILRTGIISHEPRVFQVDGLERKVTVSSKGVTSGNKEELRYTTYINSVLYDAERRNLEKSLSFKQYYRGSSSIAFEDIRKLIRTHDRNGVYLWDPYLRANDILQTLFHSPTMSVPLRAIGSINKSTSRISKMPGMPPAEILSDQRALFLNPDHNNYGINLEFRIQHTKYGWPFHDRFLIFPGSRSERSKVYSLGTSVNSLGRSHHILQEVLHPQRVIDAFDRLWGKLDHKDCLVWKFPAV